MLEGAASALMLAGFCGFALFLHGWALARATRSRHDQLRHPRYWGR